MGSSRIRVLTSADEHLLDLVRWVIQDKDLTGPSHHPQLSTSKSTEEGDWLALEERADERTLGGVVAQLYPDHTAQAVPPRMAEDAEVNTSRELLQRLTEELQRRGITLVTSFVRCEDQLGQACLTSVGFCRTHDLLVVGASTQVGVVGKPQPASGWKLRPYRRDAASELRTVFAQTLIDTQDFPDLEIDSPVDGTLRRLFQASPSGRRLWYFVERSGRLAGLLLLADHPDLNRCEVVYMGLTPEFRRMGGGCWLARCAVEQTRQLGRHLAVAAVDAQNDPAVAAYAAAGFAETDHRHVLFRRLGTSSVVNSCLP